MYVVDPGWQATLSELRQGPLYIIGSVASLVR